MRNEKEKKVYALHEKETNGKRFKYIGIFRTKELYVKIEIMSERGKPSPKVETNLN